jgi:DNA-binding GntR family transcriptional regulator
MKLAHRFGTSSTPVREALVELEAVGVVQFIHNRGAIVSPFGSKELREIYQIRRVLEAEAARCACGRVDAQALESLRREFLALQGKDDGQVHWAQQALASDRRLHELIVRSSGSDRLMNEIRRYDGLVQTIREVIGDDRAAQHRALDEHLTIVAPLLAGVPQEAAAAMSRHIESAAESFEKAMFEGR